MANNLYLFLISFTPLMGLGGYAFPVCATLTFNLIFFKHLVAFLAAHMNLAENSLRIYWGSCLNSSSFTCRWTSQMVAASVGTDASAKYDCLLFGMLFNLPEVVMDDCGASLICFFLSFSDMDDTLYPWSTGLNLACRRNIEGFDQEQIHYFLILLSLISSSNYQAYWVLCSSLCVEYMLQSLRIEESEVPRMCLELYHEHGTTMAGLKVWRLSK